MANGTRIWVVLDTDRVPLCAFKSAKDAAIFANGLPVYEVVVDGMTEADWAMEECDPEDRE